jgi:hypothetical protein
MAKEAAPEIRRNAPSQARHDRMVALQAERYRALGYAVAAEIDGWPAPAAVEGQVPDVLATRGDETVVVEVETEETLASREYADEHKAFRKWKEQAPKTREYKMVIA